MWYDYPIRKDFDVSINVKVKLDKSVFNKKLNLKFKQASILDTINFITDIWEGDASKWLLKFISEQWDADKTTLWLIKADSKLRNKIFETIKSTRFRGVFGATKTKEDEEPQPYSSILVMLCEKINVDPNTFQENYTIEQMNYFVDWIIYNINSQTEEWQEKNERIQFNKNNSNEELLELIN